MADNNKASLNVDLVDQQKARHDELAAKLEASHQLHQENLAAEIAALIAAGKEELAAKLEADQEKNWKAMEAKLVTLSAEGKDDLSSQLAAWKEQQEKLIAEKIQELHDAGHTTLAAKITELHEAGQQDVVLQLREGQTDLSAKLHVLGDEYKKALQVLMAGVAAQQSQSEGAAAAGVNQEQVLAAQVRG